MVFRLRHKYDFEEKNLREDRNARFIFQNEEYKNL